MTTSLEQYLADLPNQVNRSGRPVSHATIRATRADLVSFRDWWEVDRQLPFAPELVVLRDITRWQSYRQVDQGHKATTINRAQSSLRNFYTWAITQGQQTHNPTTGLRDLPVDDTPPKSLPPEAVDWLFRMATLQEDERTRARDLALLTLLSDCGLRSEEAAQMQLRDLDLAGGQFTVRSGKGGKARRGYLTAESSQRLKDYLAFRCPSGLPSVGSDAEREILLNGYHRVRTPNGVVRQWTPGITTAAMRKIIVTLGKAAAAKIKQQAIRESSLSRVAELEALARMLQRASPHQLRHGLAYRLFKRGYSAAYVKTLLGHSRESTALMYGKPSEEDLYAALEAANQQQT